MQPLLQALPPVPTPPPRTTRRRRANPRQRQPANMGAQGSGNINVSDAEMVAITKGFKAITFNPGNTSCPRLARYESMYERYRFRSLVVTYEPTSGTATEGSVVFAISPSTANTNVKDEATILKLQPARATPAWKRTSIRAGANLDSSRFMHSGETGPDGDAFTLYVSATKDSPGYFRVQYSVDFAFPRPF